MSELRVGIGIDAHAFSDGAKLVLGGVELSGRGLAGHSDGDVVSHALIDAILGAAGLEDIGALWRAYEDAQEAGWELVNADCVLIGQEPRIAPVRDELRERLSGAMGVGMERVTVRATTTDRLGFTGRGEGLAAQAVALLSRSDTIVT